MAAQVRPERIICPNLLTYQPCGEFACNYVHSIDELSARVLRPLVDSYKLGLCISPRCTLKKTFSCMFAHNKEEQAIAIASESPEDAKRKILALVIEERLHVIKSKSLPIRLLKVQSLDRRSNREIEKSLRNTARCVALKVLVDDSFGCSRIPIEALTSPTGSQLEFFMNLRISLDITVANTGAG